MRTIKITVVLVFLLTSCQTGIAQPEGERLVELSVQNSSGKYVITVTGKDADQELNIVLENAGTTVPIAHYSNFGFVHAVAKYPKADRLITLWETGTTITTVVFRLAPPSSNPEIVFEDNSEIEPDFINSGSGGEFMVIYSGKHFVAHTSLWLPDSATIYKWDGAAYRRLITVPYDQRFSALAKESK